MNNEVETVGVADDGPSPTGLIISGLIVAAYVILWALGGSDLSSLLAIPYLLAQVAVISVVIWQACDPFADAAQWIGTKFKLPGSVRGATLDAIASSMPELFSGIFFVLVAVSAVDPAGADPAAAREIAGAEGFGSTIATCAGSAVYNMILIPAFCALVISYTRKERPTIDVEDEVISRDGIWFVCCEILLVVFLFQETMMWWMGLMFIGLYLVYIGQLYTAAKNYQKRSAAFKPYFDEHGPDQNAGTVLNELKAIGVRATAAQIMKAQTAYQENGLIDDEEDLETSSGVFFGYIKVALNKTSVWAIIGVSTVIAAVACYFLVDATLATARVLNVNPFFVAVILAAAASSVPDTFLAIGAARRGDDSGAVSNAFGSNIFDICICLSIPLLVNSYLTGWAPVTLLQDGKPIAGLVGLRILLVVLTIINLAIMWQNRQITRNKAFVMCGLYVIFIAYAVLESQGMLF
jgi:Ca2+/Na+ antiporter